MPKIHPLIRELNAEQKRLKLSGPAMAAKLGIDGSTWSLASRGKRQPGQKVITGAITAFPKVNVTELLREAAEEAN